jgi:hypothetical protein
MPNFPNQTIGVPSTFGTKNELVISAIDGSAFTFAASISGVAGFTGDILSIAGNASNVVRVVHADVSITAPTFGMTTVLLQRRTMPDSGGGPTTVNYTPKDTNNGAPVSSVTTYSSAPTPGVPAGSPVRSAQYAVEATTGPLQFQVWEFGQGPQQAIVLRGTSQGVCLNLGTLPTGSIVSATFVWTESAI